MQSNISGRKHNASEDDWLLSNSENTAFALIATEDFKDYYESEGITGWLQIDLQEQLFLKLGYNYYETRWFEAEDNLWSLFGGSKVFRPNFSAVTSPFREVGIQEIDTAKNGELFLEVDFDNRYGDKNSVTSGWRFSGEFELSKNDLSSDFDYQKYAVQIVRYQKIIEHLRARFRARHGNSDGYLPMQQRFFLGGLGTLPGYKHKEYIGTRFWMVNSEYLVGLPTSYQSNFIIFWDVGQIANDTRLGNAEIKHSLGVGVDLGGFRLNLNKRLDSAIDRDIRIYVRFSSSF
jgi:outer membrane protein assembly factor BamA